MPKKPVMRYTFLMPNSATAEVYFIAAMMILILIVCTATVYFFFRTYKKEMRDKEARKSKSQETQEKTEYAEK